MAIKRILYTLGVIFMCSLLFQVRYPGVIFQSKIDSSSGYLLANDITSIFSQTTKPYMFANIFMHSLTLMFKYFEDMKKDNDTKRVYEFILLIMIIVISITQSLIGIRKVEVFVAPEFKSIFFVYYSLINLIISLFIAWFNRQMMLSGMGYGIPVILMLKIINIYLLSNGVSSVSGLFKMLYMHDYIYFYIMFIISIFIEKLKLLIAIKALYSYTCKYSKDINSGNIEYKPTQSNIMANILTMYTMNFGAYLYKIISEYSSSITLLAIIGGYLSSFMNLFSTGVVFSGFFSQAASTMFRLLMLFSCAYIYNSIQYSYASKSTERLRMNLCCMPNIPIGKKTDEFIESAVIYTSLFAVFSTVVITTVPILIIHILKCKSIIYNGIDIMIIVSSLMGISEFMKTIYVYNNYQFNDSNLVKKK